MAKKEKRKRVTLWQLKEDVDEIKHDVKDILSRLRKVELRTVAIAAVVATLLGSGAAAIASWIQ